MDKCIDRAKKIFDKLYVVVGSNIDKQHFFSVKDRLVMLERVIEDDPCVTLDVFEGLLVDYAKKTSHHPKLFHDVISLSTRCIIKPN